MATFQDLIDALRGYGHGATAGMITYPQAMLLAASRDQGQQPDIRNMPTARRGTRPTTGYYIGGTPQQTQLPQSTAFQDALTDVRSGNEQIAQENPLAWYGGNVAGGATLGYLTGGIGPQTGLMGAGANIAKQAGLGAAQGYNTSGNTEDATLGAIMGGTLGALGSGIGAGSRWLSERELTKMAKLAIEKLSPIPKLVTTAEGGVITVLVKPTIDEVKKKLVEEFTKRPAAFSSSVGKAGSEAIKKMTSNIIQPTITGGMLGAGTAALSGEDPMLGAKIGAGANLLRVKADVLGEVAKKSGQLAAIAAAAKPSIIPRTADILTQGTVKTVLDQKQRNKLMNEKDPWETEDQVSKPSTVEKDPWE